MRAVSHAFWRADADLRDELEARCGRARDAVCGCLAGARQVQATTSTLGSATTARTARVEVTGTTITADVESGLVDGGWRVARVACRP